MSQILFSCVRVRTLSGLAAQDDTWVSEGWTPLHYAAWVDDIDMAELLLSHGANVDAADDAVHRMS